jgi:hypothetical protein
MSARPRPRRVQPEPRERKNGDGGGGEEQPAEVPRRRRRHTWPNEAEKPEAQVMGLGPDERGEIDRRFEP